MPLADLTGQTFGQLTVIDLGPNHTTYDRKRRRAVHQKRWLCRCSCGKRKLVRGSNLVQQRTKSCGCLLLQNNRHKLTDIADRPFHMSPEYSAWQNAKQRCTNPKNPIYSNYGGRGIKVCDRWMNSFDNFLEDVGHRPFPHLTLERLNNNGNYEPGNVVWANVQDQQRNRRDNRNITWQGRTMCLSEWARLLGIGPQTFRERILKHGVVVQSFLPGTRKAA